MNNQYIGKECNKLKVKDVIPSSYYKDSNGKRHSIPAKFVCECKCGKVKAISKYDVLSGKIKSCGCLAAELGKRKIKRANQKDMFEGTRVGQLKQYRRSTNKSGIPGVIYDITNKTWIARIRVKGKLIYLGSSKDKEVAKKYREDGEKKYHRSVIDKFNEIGGTTDG
jgi:hypothetical protein